jgi:hypothetical protein
MGGLTLIPDTPETKEPWPDLKELGERLAQTLHGLDVTMPVLVSGDWGSGKTTLLEVIRKQIQTGDGLGHAILFEAWRHETEGHLLPALVRAVWDGLPEEVRSDAEKKRKFGLLWRKTLVAAKSMGSLASLAGGPVLGALFSAAVAIDDHDQSQRPSSTPVEELWKALDTFIELLRGDLKPLVILIDDLDRCSPSGAVALLDLIRLLVVHAYRSEREGGARQLRFVVALDRGVLTQAVARKYHDISRFEGNRYLEKIFPVSFDIPRPDSEAVRELVDRCFEGEGGDLTQESCQDVLSAAVFANPRLIKRCVNRLKLLAHFESLSQVSATRDGETLQAIILWLAAIERWPALRRLLSRRPPEYWNNLKFEMERGSLSDVERALVELLEEPDFKHWLKTLHRDQFARFYEADDRLRRHGL